MHRNNSIASALVLTVSPESDAQSASRESTPNLDWGYGTYSVQREALYQVNDLQDEIHRM
jgi:hypothetical protein